MSNNAYGFKLIYLIIYIPIDREYIFFHNIYYTEREPFNLMLRRRGNNPRKGGLTSLDISISHFGQVCKSGLLCKSRRYMKYAKITLV
jgi:hypothetical protein